MGVSIAIAAGIMGAIGVLCGVFLGVSSRLFFVAKNPKLVELEEVLPGTNCAICGFPSCAAAAQAVVDGEASVNVCLAGGAKTAKKVALIMGVEQQIEQLSEAAVAQLPACHHAAKLLDENGERTTKCLGKNTCVSVCKFDALRPTDDETPPVLDKEKCIACGVCERTCPQDIILFSNVKPKRVRKPRDRRPDGSGKLASSKAAKNAPLDMSQRKSPSDDNSGSQGNVT